MASKIRADFAHFDLFLLHSVLEMKTLLHHICPVPLSTVNREIEVNKVNSLRILRLISITASKGRRH